MSFNILQNIVVIAVLVVFVVNVISCSVMVICARNNIAKNIRSGIWIYILCGYLRFHQIIYLNNLESEFCASILLIIDLVTFVPLTFFFSRKLLLFSLNDRWPLILQWILLITPSIFIVYFSIFDIDVLASRIGALRSVACFIFFISMLIYFSVAYKEHKRKSKAFMILDSDQINNPEKYMKFIDTKFSIHAVGYFICFLIDGHLGRTLLNIGLVIHAIDGMIYWGKSVFFTSLYHVEGDHLIEQNDALIDLEKHRDKPEFTGGSDLEPVS